MRIERIVVATDFSPPARHALEKAVAIAARFQARLYLFHAAFAHGGEDVEAYRDGTLDDLYELAERRAREELQALGHPASASLPIVESIRVGPPADEIVAFAAEKEADLLALGTQGRTGLRRLLLGSVAESVLRRASCPVLAVRAPEGGAGQPEAAAAAPARPFARILAAVDHSESARAALRAAAELARRFSGSVLAVHVLDDQVLAQTATLSPVDAMALEGSFAQLARGDLDRFVAESLDGPDRALVTRTIELGATAEAIQRVAREGAFDLIACGTQGRTGLRRALFGSTAERIVRLAPCPVFAVREGPPAARVAA